MNEHFNRYLGFYALYASFAMVTRFIPVFGKTIMSLMIPALLFAMPLGAGLVLPILSALVSMMFSGNIINAIANLIGTPLELLGVVLFCKLRDNKHNRLALTAYYAMAVSGLIVALQILMPDFLSKMYSLIMAQHAAQVSSTEVTRTALTPYLMFLATLPLWQLIGLDILIAMAYFGLFAVLIYYLWYRPLKWYLNGMETLFRRLFPLKAQLGLN